MDGTEYCRDDDIYDFQIPESKIIAAKANTYFLEDPHEGEIHKDIRYFPLMTQASVVFAALQFALFGNPRRIFLVGCDCSDTGHFYSDEKIGMNVGAVYEGYVKLKKFIQHHYPDTEIISVNPIGLKGLFKDWYQMENGGTVKDTIKNFDVSCHSPLFEMSTEEK